MGTMQPADRSRAASAETAQVEQKNMEPQEERSREPQEQGSREPQEF